MSIGMATAIFKDIYTSVATEEEKMKSIKMVLSMETHNGITKRDFVNVLRYLMEWIGKQENGWIPAEKKPTEDGFYVVTMSGALVNQEESFVGLAEFEDGEWVDGDDVIVWKPLPDPYLPEKDNQTTKQLNKHSEENIYDC